MGEKVTGWVNFQEFLKVLYTDVRNTLVHNLTADTRPRIRRPKHYDPALVLRMRDRSVPTIDGLESVDEWPENWPVIWETPQRLVVSVLALYWHVKQLTTDLANDADLLRIGFENYTRRRVQADKRRSR
jgi:hypothetical protein